MVQEDPAPGVYFPAEKGVFDAPEHSSKKHVREYTHGEEVEAGIILLCGKFEDATHALIPKDLSLESELRKIAEIKF